MDNRPACYYYKRGWCRYGDRCRYSHDSSPPPASFFWCFEPGRPSSAPAKAARKIIRVPKPRKPALGRSASPTLEIVPPPAPADDARPGAHVYSSEYSIFGEPDVFAGLPPRDAPAPALLVPSRCEIAASARHPCRHAMSPLLTRFPCAPGDIPPKRRTYMLSQLKKRVTSLVHGYLGGRAVIELSECLDAWGFADQYKIENLCICAVTRSAHVFIAEVLALA